MFSWKGSQLSAECPVYLVDYHSKKCDLYTSIWCNDRTLQKLPHHWCRLLKFYHPLKPSISPWWSKYFWLRSTSNCSAWVGSVLLISSSTALSWYLLGVFEFNCLNFFRIKWWLMLALDSPNIIARTMQMITDIVDYLRFQIFILVPAF